MTAEIVTILFLLAVLVVAAIAARRLNTTPSILLVVAGIVVAFIPGLPLIALAPDLVLLGILPPLIYSAGVAMSWREFRFNLRPITLLAFGGVIFTACAVAAVAHFLLGMPLAVGFVLGAIVAPTDAVAPLAIVRRLGLPRRLLVVLDGEGLANDATALILYRFAVAAVSTGLFSLGQAAATFGLIVVGEIAFGIGVGWASLRLRRWARDPRVEITLSLMTPYVAFLVPQHLGGSGVLAAVAAGLFVSWNGPLLIPAATRLQGIFFWDLIVYYLEGFIFLVTGMQMRALLDQSSSVSLRELGITLALTVGVIVAARFVWVYPTVYLPRWLSRSLRKRDPLPPWQWSILLGFVGVRGVVSLAAALAIPFTTISAVSFPDRDLILFVTFGVIVVTLVGQGLMLPALVRWLALPHDAEDERRREQDAEITARLEAINVSRDRIKRLSADGKIPVDVLEILHDRHDRHSRQSPRKAKDTLKAAAAAAELRAELIAAEREYIYRLLQQGQITDEARRRIERELDLEEESLAFQRGSVDDPPL
ncbi:MAG: Na+/H+ antiporter [Hyphomicrobiales bacterium]|nr:Na+/H+ antiporter [Hyphomicrobiales bacterium]